VSDGVSYDVNAFLRTSGSFERETKMAATAADGLGSAWGRMSDKMVSAGERVRGTFGSLASTFIKGGGAAIGGGIVAGLAAAQTKGLQFNQTMEEGALGLATMYQMFEVGKGLDANVKLARAFQHELVAIADASPGTTEDMMIAYKTAAPAMSAVTQDLMRQKDVMTSLATMAWTNTEGSYKQMGTDFGRIISGSAENAGMFKTLSGPIKEAFKDATGEAALSGEA